MTSRLNFPEAGILLTTPTVKVWIYRPGGLRPVTFLCSCVAAHFLIQNICLRHGKILVAFVASCVGRCKSVVWCWVLVDFSATTVKNATHAGHVAMLPVSRNTSITTPQSPSDMLHIELKFSVGITA